MLNDDGSRLYFTNWVDAEVGYYDFKTGKTELLNPDAGIEGPARLSTDGQKLYVPDLPGSKVIEIEIQ